ncbi:MAG TPA: hypothetical protein VFF65_01175 [Phycisphaerales bacterium]|nr:hypothetical protein [Phycisphaerales bacterium]
MSDKPPVIIEAPSVLGLFPGGVELLPEALLRAGLADRLGARLAGRVEPPVHDPRRDPQTRMLNPGDGSIALNLVNTLAQGLRR